MGDRLRTPSAAGKGSDTGAGQRREDRVESLPHHGGSVL